MTKFVVAKLGASCESVGRNIKFLMKTYGFNMEVQLVEIRDLENCFKKKSEIANKKQKEANPWLLFLVCGKNPESLKKSLNWAKTLWRLTKDNLEIVFFTKKSYHIDQLVKGFTKTHKEHLHIKEFVNDEPTIDNYVDLMEFLESRFDQIIGKEKRNFFQRWPLTRKVKIGWTIYPLYRIAFYAILGLVGMSFGTIELIANWDQVNNVEASKIMIKKHPGFIGYESDQLEGFSIPYKGNIENLICKIKPSKTDGEDNFLRFSIHWNNDVSGNFRRAFYLGNRKLGEITKVKREPLKYITFHRTKKGKQRKWSPSPIRSRYINLHGPGTKVALLVQATKKEDLDTFIMPLTKLNEKLDFFESRISTTLKPYENLCLIFKTDPITGELNYQRFSSFQPRGEKEKPSLFLRNSVDDFINEINSSLKPFKYSAYGILVIVSKETLKNK